MVRLFRLIGMRLYPAVLASVFGAMLLPPAAAESAKPALADRPQSEAGLGQEGQEGEPEGEEAEDERDDPSPDALHDPARPAVTRPRRSGG